MTQAEFSDYEERLEWQVMQQEFLQHQRDLYLKHLRLKHLRRRRWIARARTTLDALFVMSVAAAFGWVLLLITRAIFHLP